MAAPWVPSDFNSFDQGKSPPAPPIVHTRVRNPVFDAAWKGLGFSGLTPWVGTESGWKNPKSDNWNPFLQGSQPDANRRVYLDPGVIKNLGRLPFGHLLSDRLLDERGSKGWEVSDPGLSALNTLLHEYVHVQQAAPIKRSLQEAGATVYSEQKMDKVLQAMGLGGLPRSNKGIKWPNYVSGVYLDEVSALLHRLGGKNFVAQGQFGLG